MELYKTHTCPPVHQISRPVYNYIARGYFGDIQRLFPAIQLLSYKFIFDPKVAFSTAFGRLGQTLG